MCVKLLCNLNIKIISCDWWFTKKFVHFFKIIHTRLRQKLMHLMHCWKITRGFNVGLKSGPLYEGRDRGSIVITRLPCCIKKMPLGPDLRFVAMSLSPRYAIATRTNFYFQRGKTSFYLDNCALLHKNNIYM